MEIFTENNIYGPGGVYSGEVLTGITGPIFLVSGKLLESNITITLIAGAGTGKIQFSTSLRSILVSDDENTESNAIWQDWEEGDITGTMTIVITGKITGLRCVSSSGTMNWEIVV